MFKDSLVENMILAKLEKVHKAVGNVRGHVVILIIFQARV